MQRGRCAAASLSLTALILSTLAVLYVPVCGALRIGIASYEPGAPVLVQNMTLGQLGWQLQALGHSVELIYSQAEFDDKLKKCDVVVTQGQAALDVSDFADKAGLPTVRFVDVEDAMNPAFERPALIVLPPQPLCRLGPPVLDENSPLPTCEPDTPEYYLDVPRFRFEGLHHIPALDKQIQKVHRRASTCEPRGILIELGIEAEEAPLGPTLGLTMMVKNEADFIVETLNSTKDFIDHWTIVDTGSTDDTPKLIEETMKDIPGELFHQKFEDFSTSRNLVMRRHGNATAYAFQLDGDYIVKNGWRLRVACIRLQKECRHRSVDVCSQAMFITKRYGGLSHMWTRVFPTEDMGTEQGWHYYYPIHEWPINRVTHYQARWHAGRQQTITMKHVEEYFINEAHERSTKKSTRRLEENDLPLLRKWRKLHPKDHRIAFYLSQTLMALQRWEEALQAYQERIDLGGYHMELYEAKMKSALCLTQMGRDPTHMLQDAWLNSPWRAEPLYELAKWHDQQLRNCTPGNVECENKHHMGAFLNAKMASEVPVPADDEGLVDLTVYGPYGHAAEMLAVHAFFVAKDTGSQPSWQRGVYMLGMTAATHLVYGKPHDQRLRVNLQSYETLRPYIFP